MWTWNNYFSLILLWPHAALQHTIKVFFFISYYYEYNSLACRFLSNARQYNYTIPLCLSRWMLHLRAACWHMKEKTRNFWLLALRSNCISSSRNKRCKSWAKKKRWNRTKMNRMYMYRKFSMRTCRPTCDEKAGWKFPDETHSISIFFHFRPQPNTTKIDVLGLHSRLLASLYLLFIHSLHHRQCFCSIYFCMPYTDWVSACLRRTIPLHNPHPCPHHSI